jgi:hypothetical protein
MTAPDMFLALETAGRAILGSDEKALDNGKLFSARLGDRVPEAKREIRIIAQALADGVSTQLRGIPAERSLAKAQIVKRLEDQHGYRQELAQRAVDLIDRLVNGETAVPVAAAAPEIPAIPSVNIAPNLITVAHAVTPTASDAPPKTVATSATGAKITHVLAFLMSLATMTFPSQSLHAFDYFLPTNDYFISNTQQVFVLSFWLALPFGLLIAAKGSSGAIWAAAYLSVVAIARVSSLAWFEEAKPVEFWASAGLLVGFCGAVLVAKLLEARGTFISAVSAGGVAALLTLLFCTLGRSQEIADRSFDYIFNPLTPPVAAVAGALGGLFSAAIARLIMRRPLRSLN